MYNENQKFLKELVANLSIEIPHRWRVQSFSKNKPSATVVAYIDARDANDLLNEYATYGWTNEYYEVSGNTYCRVGVVMPDGSTLYRSDCGVESNTDGEKGQASDAFKRACVKWGIGRFLYNLGIEYVQANEVKTQSNFPYPVDEQGKRIWDLTQYINNKRRGWKNPSNVASEQLLADTSSTRVALHSVDTTESKPALQPNASFDTEDRKTKALQTLKKAKKVSTVKGLIAEQKAFKATEVGANFVSGATIDDVVKLNDIDLVAEFYKFVK